MITLIIILITTTEVTKMATMKVPVMRFGQLMIAVPAVVRILTLLSLKMTADSSGENVIEIK